MNDKKLIPIIIKSGWCIAMINPETNEPIMFWDKILKCFNGLLTINGFYEEEYDAKEKCEEFKNNPYATCKIIPIDYKYVNGDISIIVKD